jgi:hypothetical protein
MHRVKLTNATILVLLTLCACSNATAEENIWVAIADPTFEYQAQIPVATVRAIADGKYQKQYLYLKNVYWYSDEDKAVLPQSEAGKEYGYSSEVYVRISHITRIIPLTQEHILKYKLNTRSKRIAPTNSEK